MKYVVTLFLLLIGLMLPIENAVNAKSFLQSHNDLIDQGERILPGPSVFTQSINRTPMDILRWGLILLVVVLVVFAWNLSLRRQVEKRKAAEEHFKKLSDLTYEGILFYSNGIIVDGNRQLGEMFHCSFEEMLGKNLLDYMAPQEHEKLLKILKSEENFFYDTLGIRKSGEIFDLEIQSRLLSSGDTPVRVASLRDISQRKKREQELEDSRKELEKLSQTDGLTQVFNRRYFNTMIRQSLNLAKRNHQRITTVILDVDFFKQYNDTYGHLAGDQALVQVATAVSDLFRRSTDQVFRLGGEEFAVIIQGDLKNETPEDLAERIRKEVESLEIIHESSSVGEFLTISLGILSLVPNQDVTDSDLYRLADMALYQAKEQGRNRVVVSSSTSVT
ncbi:MAG: sensor domain-containing diguanylate cyclase [Spirochaetaceae bacterium]|jgi:diguanylate cyclase (GGDEF)-like protein/PAS domain S-box-containing protein|nr:sensor domain-containing diguanylate cyclase [Spirochaetaceae bacterium]